MKTRTVAPQPTPVITKEPAALDTTAALATVARLAAGLPVTADAWGPAHEAARLLFRDLDDVQNHYFRVRLAITKTKTLSASMDRDNRLESAEWAMWHRYLQAAYVLGIAVGMKNSQRQP